MNLGGEDEALLEAFVSGAARLPEIRAVYLFGSMARGTHDADSDVDLLVVVDRPDPEALYRSVSEIVVQLPTHRDVQTVVTNLYDVDEDFLSDALGAGVHLFGDNLVALDGKPARPATVLHYDVAHLSPSQRTKVSRHIHGYRTRKRAGGRTYAYRYPGLKDEAGVRVLGPATLMLPPWHARGLVALLEDGGARYEAVAVDAAI